MKKLLNLKLPSYEKKYEDKIDLNKVFPLLGYEASQIIIKIL